MSVESYKHRFAKAVLVSWLRSWAEKADCAGFLPKDFNDWAPGLSWRVNRGSPHFGVWEEYPVSQRVGICPVWDEEPWYGPWSERPPTFDECCQLGHPPLVILDAAIQHKGLIVHGLEVVHRNDISDTKLARLKELRLPTFRFDADWILQQVDMPKRLRFERVT